MNNRVISILRIFVLVFFVWSLANFTWMCSETGKIKRDMHQEYKGSKVKVFYPYFMLWPLKRTARVEVKLKDGVGQ